MIFIIGYMPGGKFVQIEDMNKALKQKQILLMALHKTDHKRQVDELLYYLKKDGSNENIYSEICKLSERLFFKVSCVKFAKLMSNPLEAIKYRKFYGENELYDASHAKMFLENPETWPRQKPRLTIEVESEEPRQPIRTFNLNSNGMIEFQLWSDLPDCAGLKSPPSRGPKRFVFPMEISN